MADIAGDDTTTATIIVGDSQTNTIETVGDRDWFKITLTAGQEITINLNGVTLSDPYLRIRDSAGNVVKENDDIHLGVELDSQISFRADSAGVYYIDVGAFQDPDNPSDPYPGSTGDYQLSVTTFQTPPVYTNDQIAGQLTSDYWGDGVHRFDLDQSRTLTIDITGLTSEGQNLARQALQTWSDITGITFDEVGSGAQITFTDDDPDGGAFTESTYSGADIATSHVNVDTAWIDLYGANVGSYTFQAYIHEIGHALGLGHAGNYNTSADYPYDAVFLNDAWSTSVMSYFSQTDSDYFDDQGFNEAHLVTPMVADILAMQQLYGLSSATRSGNTTYGFNNNAGSLYAANLIQTSSLTIFDTGGTDTLDFSYNTLGTGNQLINLNPETFSNVGGLVGNLTIARGTIIENANGGGRNDTIIGNSVANILRGNGGSDTLSGMGGNDTLSGGSGNDNAYGGLGDDTYVVSEAGDRAIELSGEGTDVVKSTISFTLEAGSAIEQLRAYSSTSTAAIDLTGNEFGQAVVGSAAKNVLRGLGGDDRLYGLGGDDTLSGGDGNDRLYGGLGSDTYRVDQSGDRVFESVGEGADVVKATVTFSLTSGSEIEQLRAYDTASTVALDLTGNEFAQSIVGNAGVNVLRGNGGDDRLYGLGGNDVLTGGDGNDRLYGGLGNDTYRVDQLGDRVFEDAGEGTDIVKATVSYALQTGSNVEQIRVYDTASTTAINLYGNETGQSLVGNDGANLLNGLAGNDTLYGLGGNDRLEGGAGSNVLIGGAGVDRFIFSTLGVNDRITDFTTGEWIDLRGMDANAGLAGDQAFNWVGGNAFSNTAGELRTYVLNGVNYLAGDVNGDGIADFLIDLGNHHVVSNDMIF